MRYVIMCGGISKDATTSKHLTMINGETIVSRTIRLLREAGVEDIAISTNTHLFDNLGVDIIYMKNEQKNWIDGFYISPEPTCYIFGDVVFSKQAIEIIVNAKTDDIQFFASKPTFAEEYAKPHAEPFAFKVVHMQHFAECVNHTRNLYRRGRLHRDPIAWELWQVIKQTPINHIDYSNYVPINDYTCDVDYEGDIELIRKHMPREE